MNVGSFFRSPFYFFVCVAFGYFLWSFTFSSELNRPEYFSKSLTDDKHADTGDFERARFENQIQQSDFSSSSSSQPESPLSDEQVLEDPLLKELELTDEEWNEKTHNPYEWSPAELHNYDQIYSESYGSKIPSTNYMQIAAPAPLVEYQSAKSCETSQLAVENILQKSKEFQSLLQERSTENKNLPRVCLTHIMRNFNVSKASLARCPKGANSRPERQGVKPCITSALVNTTYNAYVDVTDCLGFAPKSLLPKLSNESGFLINTLGSGFDAGVGQLTAPAIEETNKKFDKYMAEIKQNATSNSACARVLKYDSSLSKVGHDLSVRCSLIAPPTNPLKNILYMAMLNRMNLDYMKNKFEQNDIFPLLQKLGLSQINQHQLIEMMALAAYNAGPGTAFGALQDYIQKRLKANLRLTMTDFDFYNPKTMKDLDGKEKTVTQIAMAFARSPLISKKESPVDKKIKLQRAKLLPEKIRKSYTLTFPEFMIYSQNNFDENQKTVGKGYRTIGAPGYLSLLAAKDKALRQTFQEAGQSPDYCSDPQFLKIK